MCRDNPDAPKKGKGGLNSITITSLPTTRYEEKLFQDNTNLGTTSTMLNSGSSVNIVSMETANRLKIRYQPHNDMTTLSAANGGRINVVGTTNIEIQMKLDEPSQTIELLISDNLQTTDIILAWFTMKKQGVLSDGGLMPCQDQIHSMFSLEPTRFEIPEANREFLKNLPPQRTYIDIDTQSLDWEGESKKLGSTIREDLIQDFKIAFKSKGDHTPSFAVIPPVEITMNEGAKPVF